MARMRSVKPEFWADEDLSALPRDARLLYVGLWNLADEHSRLRGDPRYVKGQLFPYDDDLPATDVDRLLGHLADIGKVVRYRHGGAAYIFLPTLSRHQRLESDKVPSRLPPPPEQPEPTRVDESESRADLPAPDADTLPLKHVAGGMEHVAGKKERARPRESTSDPPDFARFWDAYPRKEAKGAARKAWDKAVCKIDADSIIGAAKRYRDDPDRRTSLPKFTAHPATWLNGERWADQPTRGSPSSNGHRPYRDPDDPSAYHGDL